MNKLQRMKEIVSIMEPAGRAYYTTDKELISNFEWDSLYDELLALEEETGIILAGSPTQKVGYKPVSSLAKKKHPQPMLSLDKTKDVSVLAEKAGIYECFLSWKMDGLTIVAIYEEGKLVEAVTRGNGEVGEVITHNAPYIKGLPQFIPEKNHKVIRGEAVISYDSFKAVNKTLPTGSEPYKNPRNLCAGTIRNYDPAVVASRGVTFLAFDYVEGSSLNSHKERMDSLKEMGFGVVEGMMVTKETMEDAVKYFEKILPNNEFPSDGLVLVYDDISYGKSLGTTSKFPRNGLAFKWKDQKEETTIREIEWSVSRTSLINPVAIFDTIDLEGSNVSRASLHNLSIIKKLQIGIGDRVKVIKANMIIPQIVENITKSGTLKIPTECPVCHAPTKVKIDPNSGCETLYCTGDNCLSTAISQIDHFCSRDAMGITGISEKTIESFIEEGILGKPIDLYQIERHKDKILNLDNYGRKSFEKLLKAINGSKEIEIYRFLYALGIPNFGLSNCKRVCRELNFKSINDFAMADKEALIGIEGIGENMADSFILYFRNNFEDVNLFENYITFKEPDSFTVETKLKGIFVITGSLNRMSRKELQNVIEAAGGKVAGSVSSKTTVLINNDAQSKSSKNMKAKELGVPIMTEEEFFTKYNL